MTIQKRFILDIPEENFNFDRKWLVLNIDDNKQAITYGYHYQDDVITLTEELPEKNFLAKKAELVKKRTDLILEKTQKFNQGLITEKELNDVVLVYVEMDHEIFYESKVVENSREHSRNIEYFF
ncbi:hypothetical protein IGK74_002326 [Enterococcus sp. AZ150]|uniref:hypothetical protein n=1 Tax=Enterococcus sp. AZ150 TaxID=2774866 RepID=UPI003F1FEC3B